MSIFVKRKAAIQLVLLMVAASILLWCFLPYLTVQAAIREGGPIEDITLVLYLVAAVSVFSFLMKFTTVKNAVSLAILLAAMFARECDFHNHFTGVSVFKIRYWLSDAPYQHKLVALALISLVVVSLFYLIKDNAHKIKADNSKKISYSYTVITLLWFIPLTKLLDRSPAILREKFGLDLDDTFIALLSINEELLECGIPILVVLAIFQFVHYKRETANKAALRCH
jgi:hypothetical protein